MVARLIRSPARLARLRFARGRAQRAVLVAAAVAAVACLAPGTAPAAVSLTTDYPAVEVEAGGSVTLPLHVSATPRQRVDLEIVEVPERWSAVVRGGGLTVSAVHAGRGGSPPVELEVDSPPDAGTGTYRVVLSAQGEDGSSSTLELDLRVGQAAQGGVTLATEFPVLRGPSDATFSFDLDLANETPREIRFALEAQGPPGWQVEARPSGETLASTVTVPAGESDTVVVEADPPDDTPAGAYPIRLRVSGEGETTVADLSVEIVGNFALTLTTATERLDTDVQAGDPTDVQLLVVNEGTAPLVGVQLSSTPPSGWRVEFQPEVLEVVAPQDAATVRATITPSGDAVAGDYLVSVSARTPETSDSVELRATVETSRVWGIVGLALIAAAVIALILVFRRLGRR